jgi:hypothetical protein
MPTHRVVTIVLKASLSVPAFGEKTPNKQTATIRQKHLSAHRFSKDPPRCTDLHQLKTKETIVHLSNSKQWHTFKHGPP